MSNEFDVCSDVSDVSMNVSSYETTDDFVVIPDDIPEDVPGQEASNFDAMPEEIPSDIPEDTLSLDSDVAEVENDCPSEVLEDVEGEDTAVGNDPELMETPPMETLDDWVGDINPYYNEFDVESPYSTNCGSCALAVFQRLEGDGDACASSENIGTVEEMEALTGMEQVAMSPDEIEDTLLAQGPGAHAIIGVDRVEGAGHWFNAANVDGKIVVIDGQNGSVSDWPPDYGDVVHWDMSMKKG